MLDKKRKKKNLLVNFTKKERLCTRTYSCKWKGGIHILYYYTEYIIGTILILGNWYLFDSSVGKVRRVRTVLTGRDELK